MARRRKRWKAHQMKVEPQRLVFIDETWIKTNMAPLRGWAPRGKRLRAYAPFGHWKTLTFIAALRCDRIEAPFVLDGPINGQAFRLYVETQLAPTLRPGDVVVMDNLGSHKGRHPKPRRSSALPAGLQPGPEPHRAGLRQAQAPHAQVPAQRRRGRVANGRTNPRALHTKRMRQLPRQRRIRFCLIAVRSRRHSRIEMHFVTEPVSQDAREGRKSRRPASLRAACGQRRQSRRTEHVRAGSPGPGF